MQQLNNMGQITQMSMKSPVELAIQHAISSIHSNPALKLR
jgi:hypothetical protein